MYVLFFICFHSHNVFFSKGIAYYMYIQFYSASIILTWFCSRRVQVLSCPAFSPISPIENIWHIIKWKIQKTTEDPRQLKFCIRHECHNIFLTKLQQVISVPRSMQRLTGENSNRKRSGRTKATRESDDKFLRVNGLCDRWLTGQMFQEKLNTGLSKQVSVSAVKRRLEAASLSGWVVVRKSLLKWQNKKARYDHEAPPVDFWRGRKSYGQMNKKLNSFFICCWVG